MNSLINIIIVVTLIVLLFFTRHVVLSVKNMPEVYSAPKVEID